MFKKLLIVVFLLIAHCSLLMVSYAQETDSVTIVTYYPSPYGVYREMRAQRMAIGETYINNSVVCWQGDTGCTGFPPQAMIPTGAFDPDVDLIVQGNVGIGTTGPTNTFTIKSSSGTLAGGRIIPATTNIGGTYLQTTDEAQSLMMGGMEYGSGSQFYARSTEAGMISINGFGSQTGIQFSYDTGLTAGNLFTPTRLMVIQPDGNVGIGTTSPGGGGSTAGTAVLSLANGTAPVGGVANQASLYAADVAASSELFALDEAGIATQISPHDPVTGEWIFYSKNTVTGRVVRVDMERMVKAIEKITGEKFMVEKWEVAN